MERRTKASFSVPLQADNRRDGEHPMHTGTNAAESDNSIYQGLFVVCFKERSFWADAVDQGKRTTLNRWKLLQASWQVLLSVTLPSPCFCCCFFPHIQERKKKKKSLVSKGNGLVQHFVSTIFRTCKYSDVYLPGIVEIPHWYHIFNWRFIYLLWWTSSARNMT